MPPPYAAAGLRASEIHWRAKSKLADIEAGLQDLAHVLEQRAVKSVATRYRRGVTA
jgi:hypothetical protein